MNIQSSLRRCQRFKDANQLKGDLAMTTTRIAESTASRDNHRWLSPQEVCDELRIPKQTFYQWRARHVAPPAYRFGKLLRIDRSEFEEWLANHAENFSRGG